ncbi:MAG: hypothetical protein LCH26_05590 [Proteobacteria bacterium]|nr:hypothetical protein [Pseudomonadota bacterium]
MHPSRVLSILLALAITPNIASASLEGRKPILSQDFCRALMANRTGGDGGGIDASGNLVGATREVQGADLPQDDLAKDDLGRAVPSADLPSSKALKIPDTLTMPLSFAVSKAPLQIATQNQSATTTTGTSVTTTNTQSTTTPSGTSTLTGSVADPTTHTSQNLSATIKTPASTTTGAATSVESTASSTQTSGTTTGTIEGFDKSAQLLITIHKDGRLELGGEPLPQDDTKELYGACQAFLAQADQGQ